MYGTDSQNGFDRGRNGIDYMRNKSACPRGHALEVPNLVGAQVRRGYRTCLACSRATANKRRHPEIDFVATANAHYAKIMTQAGKTAP